MVRTHRTMQGREIDMEKLRNQNELMPAVGNMKVNARGDEIGPGGKILRTREQIMAEYYDSNPNATPDPVSKPKQTQPAQNTDGPAVPPPQTLKIEDTKPSDVVETVAKSSVVDPESVLKKTPELANETLAKVEESAVEKAQQAAERARRRRSGIKDATGE